ncbi:TPA: hypothetical protein ACJ5TE_001235 [Streptococcus agalactiae]
MKIEDIERIISEYLIFRSDIDGCAVIDIEDFLSIFVFRMSD